MALTKTPICDFGKKAHNFNLKSTENKMISLNDVKGENGTLIMFICNHCPYVLATIKETVNNCKELENNGIKSIAIMSNDPKVYEEDSFENMVSRMEEFNCPWTYLYDESQKIAQSFGALKTPHFFIFDQNWKLLYTGRNTDNPRNTDLRTTDDLHDALRQAVAGENITVPITNPIGCNIKWDGKPAHWMPAEACDLI